MTDPGNDVHIEPAQLEAEREVERLAERLEAGHREDGDREAAANPRETAPDINPQHSTPKSQQRPAPITSGGLASPIVMSEPLADDMRDERSRWVMFPYQNKVLDCNKVTFSSWYSICFSTISPRFS